MATGSSPATAASSVFGVGTATWPYGDAAAYGSVLGTTFNPPILGMHLNDLKIGLTSR
ncbi:MAG TPA: hypothetical protein VG346_05140 [Acidimicrobiales bacterium]|nr:hypothetical protein [Acidimicrobiales bacterium]